MRDLSNPQGGFVTHYAYAPFGGTRSASGPSTPFRFTGQQQDDTTGLYYLRARYYNAQTGRFLSRDPFPGLATLPGTLHPYAYALNNPARYTDPSGEFVNILIGAGIGGAAGAIVYFATKPANSGINSRDLAIAIGMGALSGGLIASGAPWAIAVAVAGLSSAASQAFACGCFNWPAMAGMYVNGAVATSLAAAMPWAWGTHLIAGILMGGVTGMAGDVSGRLTEHLLGGRSWGESLQNETVGSWFSKTFVWGAGFGLLGVGVNKTLLKTVGRYAPALFKEGTTLTRIGRQRQPVAVGMLVNRADHELAIKVFQRGIVQRGAGAKLLEKYVSTMWLVKCLSLYINGTFNSNYGQNVFAGSSR